jgi:hypothetical protein
MKHWKVTFKVGAAKRVDFNHSGWTHLGTFPDTPTVRTHYMDMWERTFTNEAEAIECYLNCKKLGGLEDVTLHIAEWKLVLPA